MKITSAMIVEENVKDTEADVRMCRHCGTQTFHIPQTVMVFTAGGARHMRLWVCESHMLPETVTDNPDKPDGN